MVDLQNPQAVVVVGMHLRLQADQLLARRTAAEVLADVRVAEVRRNRIVDRAAERDRKHNPIVDRVEARSKLTEPDKAERAELAQVKQAIGPEPVERTEAVPDKPATARTIARLEITPTTEAVRRTTTVADRQPETTEAERRTATVLEQAAQAIKARRPATEVQAEQEIVPASPPEPAMSR
jgi:hypothetical protein